LERKPTHQEVFENAWIQRELQQMSFRSPLITFGLCLLFITGCKQPLEIIGEGDIFSSSGDRDCTLEDFQDPNSTVCEGDIITGAFDETYYAVARQDYYFHTFAKSSCDNENAECRVQIQQNLVDLYPGVPNAELIAIFRPDVITGFNSLLAGHSFFQPFTLELPALASQAGFVDHDQVAFFAPGVQGAPLELWEHPIRAPAMKGILDAGDVDLFGLTFQPDSPDFIGYKNWVKYARGKNPDTRFFIAMPWTWYADTMTAAEYETEWLARHQVSHDLIDQLRAKYQISDIYCIPQGQAAVDLYNLLDDNNLPDVNNTLVSPLSGDSIFLDSRGHPDEILVDLGKLVWLGMIYDVDIPSFAGDPNDPVYTTDLNAMAQAIIDNHDPAYSPPEWNQ
jgi:hypothetical protein